MSERSTRARGQLYLSGWKEIAVYLGKGVRTIQRYECELGLPVRRPAGRPHAAVVATKKEIDAWVAASPIRQTLPLARQSAPASCLALSRNIEEMRELRRQMAALRSELTSSINMLRQSVSYLHWGGAHKNSTLDLISKAGSPISPNAGPNSHPAEALEPEADAPSLSHYLSNYPLV